MQITSTVQSLAKKVVKVETIRHPCLNVSLQWIGINDIFLPVLRDLLNVQYKYSDKYMHIYTLINRDIQNYSQE